MSFRLSTIYTECFFRCLKIECWASYKNWNACDDCVLRNVISIMHKNMPIEFREKIMTLNCNLISSTGLAIHNGSKSSQPFQGMSCRNCGAWFVDEKQFLHHMAVIENQSVCAICRECGKYFISADGFKFHMKMNHGSAEECPECNVCGKRFQTKHHLRRHMTMHSTAKPFSCSICGTRFKRKDHLQKHVICTHHKSPS